MAVIGLAVTSWGGVPAWHLLWYTPLAIVLAYFFSLRHLLVLSSRIDKIIDEHSGDLEDLRQRVEQAVDEYNEDVDEEQRGK